MENQSPQAPPIASAGVPKQTTTPQRQVGAAATGEWPPVPPAPLLLKPETPPAPPDPPVLVVGANRAADAASPPAAGAATAAGAQASVQATAPPSSARPATKPGAGPRTMGAGSDESPLLQLQRAVRRQQAYARSPRQDLVWQPRFAYTSALVILLALTVVSMPLWIVLYRIPDASANGGAGPRVADLVALCMMLLGGFLAAAAAWVIIIEMRGRVRMVDTLARTSEREMISLSPPELPVLDAPLDAYLVSEPITAARSLPRPAGDPAGREAGPTATSFAARAEAQQVNAASMLEASSKLLASFSSVLRSFGQLPAQVAMLVVALALFVGATVLSLNS